MKNVLEILDKNRNLDQKSAFFLKFAMLDKIRNFG